ncbi:hypothetical protein GCM10011504_06240 [Siccirubricoccus deserti]|uniref:Uncharacterized protein n=1 Tax=Siccirubricoccus deserti TaxID=2013562 RepID=A0A9X0QVB6_9PROT|nr:hypothetical protein [Siccirubricoccus deserti]MBC4013943.1 hypothetical protein [Siccirubricoccus deserti]GGC30783.1 hypothetical protein GCM10011504_06240 [Siccirubricoccus deserti]
MAPRLRLLLLLPAGCAGAEAPTAELRAALDQGSASLAAMGQLVPATLQLTDPPPDTPPSGDAIAWPHRPARPGGPRAAAQLLGVGPGELRRLLGEPTLRRAEGTAEVWLYAGGGCALDLILYPAARGGLRVAHAAARANGAEARTEAACLGEIAGVPQDTPRAGSGA